MGKYFIATILVAALTLSNTADAQERDFQEGALIIPMDLTYQDSGVFQAYGLIFQLLRQGITVYWVIDPDKSWHTAACDEAGDECAWDCEEEGSGIKCPYPTASPDMYASAEVVWDNSQTRPPLTVISLHGYRGGPFVIDATEAAAAMEVIDIWNTPDLWAANPWADRAVFEIVSVHEVSALFSGNVRKTMTAAPSIAVFSDGNEDIATGYLRAAGIPQSNGNEFPAAKCGVGTCGPGTQNPDMLTVESIMGEMGTCDAPNYDHRNGALFTQDGAPAYCQIMSMHWNVNDRETVECDGGACGATQADCNSKQITYHGHEVVAEVRQFLQHKTHFFAECQAVNAYENTAPNSLWPFLDDDQRDGHFLTTLGINPDCPCTDGDFECIPLGCDDGTRDCCMAKNDKEKGAGFMIAAQPDSNTLQILHPEVPYMQMDGLFQTVGGSEPAYNLSAYLGTEYKNDMDVTFITGPLGPGDSDVWMTGYIDGACSIVEDDVNLPGDCTKGKVSYLGGHEYSTSLPLSSNGDSQGTRLFLNALFEADCVSAGGQPQLSLSWQGTNPLPSTEAMLPVTSRYTLMFSNSGGAAAQDAQLAVFVPAQVSVPDFEEGATDDGTILTWTLGSIGESGSTSPAPSGSRWLDISADSFGDVPLEAVLTYRVGVSTREMTSPFLLRVMLDTDNDGVPDEFDPEPLDPTLCGDADFNGCDDCGPQDDCQGDPDGGVPDADTGTSNDAGGGCSCTTGGGSSLPLTPLILLMVLVLVGRRRGF
ncbi:hypothetical protein KKF84_05590 [Myxococcota bacterium]|nr:hypothetical protein [Myxococcota bacterium]